MAEKIPVHRRRSAPQPVHSAPIPPSPPHLSAEAAELWCSIVDQWDLGPDALAILRGALQHLDEYEKLRRQVQVEGATYTTESGMIRQHPAAKLSIDHFSAFRMAMRSLGLEPEDG